MLILGLGNKARNGKDTFADAVNEYYARQNGAALRHNLKTVVVVQRHAFADALYKEVNTWLLTPEAKEWLAGGVGIIAGEPFPINPTVVGDNYIIPPNATGRFTHMIPGWVQPTPNAEISARAPYGKHAKLLQWWGTEYRRSQDHNYWVKRWADGINKNADIVLVTDMRFANEAAAIKLAGGYTVKVSRENVDGTPFVDPSRDPNHVSETELDSWNYDYQIKVKTGDVALLQEWAITLVHYLRARKGRG